MASYRLDEVGKHVSTMPWFLYDEDMAKKGFEKDYNNYVKVRSRRGRNDSISLFVAGFNR